MKIAMIGHKRIPSREGGVEIVVKELSERLVKLGNEVVCYNRRGNHVSGKSFNNEKLNVYNGIKLKNVLTVNMKGLAAMSSSFFAAVRAALGNYDVVHFHAEGPCAMCFIPKLFGKKVVATIHGLDWQRAKWGGFATKYIRFGEKMAVKYADEIIVLSENVKTYFKDTYGRDVTFIPNGISKPDCREADKIKANWGLSKDDYILFLGRLVPEKGIDYLIDAYKNIKTDKKLVIAGGSSDTEDFMNQMIQKSCGNENVIFTGFVQGEILEELYSNAYVYVLPSDLEGMPISLLEAMSYGNCCLVSDIDECASVVDDKAVVFEKSNVVDLQDKLEDLLNNPDKVSYYKNGASEFVCNKYNWDDVVEKTLELYKK